MHTPTKNLKFVPLLDPQARTATATSEPVDCLGFTHCTIVVHLGVHDISGGDETIRWKVQESSDDGDADAYADVASATTATVGVAAVPDATVGEIYTIDLDLQYRERYLQVVSVVAGATISDVYGITAILSGASDKPTENTIAPVVIP
jgi:hypothetical protein